MNRFVWVIFMAMALMFASFLAGYTNAPAVEPLINAFCEDDKERLRLRVGSLNVQNDRMYAELLELRKAK